MEPTLRKIIICAVVCVSVFLAFNLEARSSSPNIRVSILKEADHFVISARGKYSIINAQSGKELLSGRRLRPSRVLAHEGRLHIGKFSTEAKSIKVLTEKDIRIHKDKVNKRYRQSIHIHVGKDEKLNVLNVLDLESYVSGVLYHEITDEWPMEAMKAQAVAARTYAMFRIQENKDLPYDVSSDIYSQVYGGRSAERYRTGLAVKKTKGEILKYRGKIFPTYFHSNSGGHTEDAVEMGWEDLAPLKGVKDNFVKKAPGYKWKKNLNSAEVQEALEAKGIKVGKIKNISILGRTKSGRVRTLQFTSRDGTKTNVKAREFRSAVGPNKVRSTMFDIKMKGWFFDLIGHGWGHGVGMSQWGAHEFAKKRATYVQILNHYYPGAKIKKLK